MTKCTWCPKTALYYVRFDNLPDNLEACEDCKDTGDGSVECISCGILLSKEDMNNHDDIDCLDYLIMMRKYNYILG